MNHLYCVSMNIFEQGLISTCVDYHDTGHYCAAISILKHVTQYIRTTCTFLLDKAENHH